VTGLASQRLFYAIHPSEEARHDLGAVVETLGVSRANSPGHSTRLTRPENWHITVAFVGDVPTERVATAVDVLRAAAGQAGPVRLRFARGGIFGKGRSAILWAGVDGDISELRELGGVLRRGLRRARLPFDAKPLRPHLTLSRPGDRVSAEQVARDVETLSAYAGPPWWAQSMSLMRSETERTETGPQPRYVAIATEPFAAAGSAHRTVG
jgi:2'-5' RNA ligase